MRLRIPRNAQIKAVRLADAKTRMFKNIKQAAKECNVTENYVTKSLIFADHISNNSEQWSPRTSRGEFTKVAQPEYRFEIVLPTEFTLVPQFNGIISVIFLRTNQHTKHIPLLMKRGYYDSPSESYYTDDVIAEPFDFPSAYAVYQFLGISKATFYNVIRSSEDTLVDYFGNKWTLVAHRVVDHAKGTELRNE